MASLLFGTSLMKKLLKNKKFWLIFSDVALPLLLIGCLWLSQFMLSFNNPCAWTLLGGQCLTCGGTHFVRDLLSGHILTAFTDNALLFLLTVYFAVTYILLHLHWLAGLPFARKVLSKMYNLPVFFAWIGFGGVFLIVRNIPMFINIYRLITRN